MKTEIAHVERERSIAVLLDGLPDLVDVLGLAIRRHAHDLVFALVHFESEERRERAVKQTERMRKLKMMRELDLVAGADAEGRRAPFADAVERQNRRVLEWTRKKRARRVALMMIDENNWRSGGSSDSVSNQPGKPRFFLEPQRHRHPKAAEPARRERKIRLEQALELPQRLLIEGDVVEILGPETALLETIANGVQRKSRIVLLPGEPLFLSGRHDVAIDDQRGCAVVIEGRDSQYGCHDDSDGCRICDPWCKDPTTRPQGRHSPDGTAKILSRCDFAGSHVDRPAAADRTSRRA